MPIIMRIKTIFFVISILTLMSSTPIEELATTHYVFKTFRKGTVIFKNGTKQDALLNYNLATNEMIFEQNGVNLALSNVEAIDTIYISSYKFIPVKKEFFLLSVAGSIPLYIEYTCKVDIPPKEAAYGGTSQLSSTSSLSSLSSNGIVYQLQLPTEYKVEPYKYFWTKESKKGYVRINSVKKLVKVFPEKANEIDLYIQNNKPNFSNQEDVEKLFKAIN